MVYELIPKRNAKGVESSLSPKEKSILVFISNHSGTKSGAIAFKLKIPNPTVKKIVSELVSKNLIEKYGSGPGTNYAMK